LLSEADLETVPITAGSIGAGKLIRELQLRTQTGASVVGIERNGTNVINPGPDEELQAGDQVLILGNSDQLAAAKLLLAKSASLPG
jgi:CPA2 family monovalent cation:H+ antiporter-2